MLNRVRMASSALLDAWLGMSGLVLSPQENFRRRPVGGWI